MEVTTTGANGGEGGFVEQTMRNSNIKDGVVKPDTSGWNITSSSTVNPDGSGFKAESLATTEGSRNLAGGGKHQFAGLHQNMETSSQHGDDKNFVKSAAESSNTKLQESTVIGDEKSGRIEKKSSTVVSSSSKSFSQKQTMSGDGIGFDPNVFGIDNNPHDFPALERRDSTQSNMSNATDFSTRSNQQQSLKEKLAMTRQNVESRSTSSIKEEEHHHQTQQRSTSTQQHRQHYEIGGQHHLRETDNNEREHQRYQEELERKLAQELAQQRQHHTSQHSTTTEQRNVTSQQQKILRENVTREEQIRQQQQQQHHQQTKSGIENIDERYLTKYTDNSTGTTVKKSGVINEDSPPELQAQFEKLKAQPGKIISEDVSYPKPGVKMITRKKELPDGTIVTTRDYETKGATTEKVHQEKVVSGSTQKVFSKQVDQRGQQILRDVDRVDHARGIHHDDHVEKIQDAVESININKTVKKDLSRSMRDEADYIETERGCNLVDRNTSERYTDSNCEKVLHHTIEKEDDFRGTHGFPSQKGPNERSSPYKDDGFRGTHGFPSARSPDRKSNYSTTSTTTEHHESQKHNDGFRGTHGFPSARSPDRKSNYSTTSTTTEHHENRKHYHEEDHDGFRGTHGFPSARNPNDDHRRPPDQFDHSPHGKQPREDDFLGTHGFPSARTQNDVHQAPHRSSQSPTSNKPATDEDFRGTHGFPSSIEKREQKHVETTQQQHQQQYVSSSTVKHVDAAHEAFARSLRCQSPIDNTRRGSNASQRSNLTNKSHTVRSRDSPARERSVNSDISSSTVTKGSTSRTSATKQHQSKDVYHSNETIDLPSKTITTKTTTTKITSQDAAPGFRGISSETSSHSRSTTSAKRESPYKY